MRLSLIDKKIVESIREDLKNSKHSTLKTGMLSAAGAAELVQDRSFTFNLRNLNNRTAIDLLRMIKNNEVLNTMDDREKCEYCAYIFNNKSLAFLRKHLREFPDFITYYLVSRNQLFDEAIMTFDVDEQKIIFDNYFALEKKNYLPFSKDHIYKYMVNLSDEDKINYIRNTTYTLYFSDLDVLFDSFKSREALIEAINVFCEKSFAREFSNVDKYLSSAELLEVMKPKIAKSFYDMEQIIQKFDFEQQVDILNYLFQNNTRNVIPFANMIIKDNIEKNGDLDVFNKISQLFVENDIPNHTFDLHLAKEIIDSMDDEQLFNLYVNCSYDPIKQYIKSNKDFWQKEPLLSYIISNEIEFICSYIYQEKDLNDKEKGLFLSKDVIEQMTNKLKDDSKFNFIITHYQKNIEEYFKDEEFVYRLLKNNPDFIKIFFNENRNPDLIRYAYDNGYVPDAKIYNLYKDRPDIIDVWFKCVKDFDSNRSDFSTLFNGLIYISDYPELTTILMQKAASNLGMSYENFSVRFDALKKVNSEILSTLDYRLFDEKFSFLSTNKIEILGANKNVSSKLCDLSLAELNVVRQAMMYSSSINWIDLLDRILNYIVEYRELVSDLSDKNLTVDEVSLLMRIMIHSNYLKINSYDDLLKYDEKVNMRIDSLISSNDIEKYKELNSLALLGIDYQEFSRIYSVYCVDLEGFCKISENEDLKSILTLVKNISECNSIETLKEIYDNTPRLKLSSELIVNLDSEIRREFAKMYNNSLYKVSDEDKIYSKKFDVKIDESGKASYVPSKDGNGVEVQFYSPIGFGEEQKEFSLIMTSLGAYSDHSEPDDYYSNWNVDLIQSHGFCCSYLKNDNLGTARICHACLGFTDFDLDALLLSAPYDLASAHANTKFNTSREINAKFYTPRGMADATRHTHNEMVFERRNLNGGDSFKKKPAYAVFFCNDFDSLNDEEKKIYESTVKAAIQLGRDDKPLPVIVVDRNKISKYQSEQINNNLVRLLDKYEAGLAKNIITSFINNRVGNTYAEDINNKYFSVDFQKRIIDVLISRIIDLKKQGLTQEAMELYNEIENTLNEEINKSSKSGTPQIFIEEFNKFKNKISLLEKINDNDSPLFREMFTCISDLTDGNCLKRWNSVESIDTTGFFISNEDVTDKLMSLVDTECLSTKIRELEEDNIYIPDSPYNNRYIANKFLYSLLMLNGNNLPDFDNNVLLDAIKYQRCSYMDGHSQKNVLSSINKAEELMRLKNYDQKYIDKIKLLIFLQDKKDITTELVDDIIQRNRLNTIRVFDINELQKAINIMHDAECLEHTRFITAGDIDRTYFYDTNNFLLTKFAYQLQESYALMDIKDYIKSNPDSVSDISDSVKQDIPQKVIRSIRKGEKIKYEHKNNTYENAFLEIDVLEKTDPLNLIQEKMKIYGELPEQIPIMEFYSQVESMSNYKFLSQKIETRENLYLNFSEIHGATHANNVSLFATYIASSLGLDDNDIKTIIEASIYHDIGRTSDTNSNNHGEFGAIKYGTNVECPETIKENEVKFLIEAHALYNLNQIDNLFTKYNITEEDKNRLYVMATVIRDADALDRTRFCLLEPRNNLKADFLVNDISKKMIESCQRLNYIIYQDYIKEKMKTNNASFTK